VVVVASAVAWPSAAAGAVSRPSNLFEVLIRRFRSDLRARRMEFLA
jgi:hypothetical protein